MTTDQVASIVGIISGLITIVSTLVSLYLRLTGRSQQQTAVNPPVPVTSGRQPPSAPPVYPGQSQSPGAPAAQPYYPDSRGAPGGQVYPPYPYPTPPAPVQAVRKASPIPALLIGFAGAVALAIYAYDLYLYATLGATDAVEHTIPTICILIGVAAGIAGAIRAGLRRRYGWVATNLFLSFFPPGLGPLLYSIFG